MISRIDESPCLGRPSRAALHWVLAAALLLVAPSAAADTVTWGLDNAADYSFDPQSVVITGSAAHLRSFVGGSGADGALVVTSASFNLSTDASGGRTQPDGISWSVTESLSIGAGSLTLQGYAGGLVAGDELLLLSAHAAGPSSASVGNWESVRVIAVDAAGVVTHAPLSRDYAGDSDTVFAQRVPNYASVTLSVGVLTANAWDGSLGGVVALRCFGALDVGLNSKIDASELGYRGGAGGVNAGGGGGGETWVAADGNGGNVQGNGTGGGGAGEGSATSTALQGGNGGYGAGGGGADGTNNSDDGAGGGGGGSYGGGGGGGGGGTGCGGTVAGSGGLGGAAGVLAGGGGTSSCAGGNGGDAGSAGQKGNSCGAGSNAQAGAVGSGATGGGGGDTCGANYGGGGGGGGGVYGSADLQTLFFGGGGGGGGGSSYGFTGGGGGRGGGIIWIAAYSMNVAGSIKAKGASGGVVNTAYRSANGGSGAGGSIYLQASSIPAGASALSTEGAPPIASISNWISGGGGGGEGRVHVAAGSIASFAYGTTDFDAQLALLTFGTTPSSAALTGGFSTSATVCANLPVGPSGSVVWTSLSSTEGGTGSITFRLSPDGASYLWWDGSAWVPSNSASDSAPASVLSAQLGTYPDAEMYWCAEFSSDGSQAVSLDKVRISYELDADGDGDPDSSDCDDADATIYSGATETCDAIDSDCDGSLVDEFTDTDSDGEPDCEDTDDDGDGIVDSADSCPAGATGWLSLPATDFDGDGCQDSSEDLDDDGDGDPDATDCADLDPLIGSNAPEVCDGIDNNCDSQVDEGAAAQGSWYPDLDGDGYGNSAAAFVACDAPPAYIASGGDCDDLDALTFPGAAELCDGADNNCDGTIDEGVSLTWYLDADGDGYGDASSSTQACNVLPGYSGNSLDCDDSAASTNPGSFEICDGADNDCDSEVDEASAINAPTWYGDGDGDGFGVAGTTSLACNQPTGFAAQDGDCDDAAAGVFPGATELCDTIDSDCDGDYVDGFTDTDFDGDPDCTDPDDDNDGLSDADEASVGSDPLDSDTDGDGIDDGDDGLGDDDGDGIPNVLDPTFDPPGDDDDSAGDDDDSAGDDDDSAGDDDDSAGDDDDVGDDDAGDDDVGDDDDAGDDDIITGSGAPACGCSVGPGPTAGSWLLLLLGLGASLGRRRRSLRAQFSPR